MNGRYSPPIHFGFFTLSCSGVGYRGVGIDWSCRYRLTAGLEAVESLGVLADIRPHFCRGNKSTFGRH